MDSFAWLNDQLLRMNWLSDLVRLINDSRGWYERVLPR